MFRGLLEHRILLKIRLRILFWNLNIFLLFNFIIFHAIIILRKKNIYFERMNIRKNNLFNYIFVYSDHSLRNFYRFFISLNKKFLQKFYCKISYIFLYYSYFYQHFLQLLLVIKGFKFVRKGRQFDVTRLWIRTRKMQYLLCQ